MAKDPYKYFRIEGRELVEGLVQGVLELEKGPPGKEVVGRLLRLTHTLKGAARVVRLGRIAELAHGLEDALAPHREGGGAFAPGLSSELLRSLDAISAELAAIGPGQGEPPETAAQGRPTAASGGGDGGAASRRETIRLEVGDTDALLEGVVEATVQVGGLRRHVRLVEEASRASATLVALLERRGGDETGPLRAALAGTRCLELSTSLERLSRDLGVSVEQAERELDLVREKADRLRLVAASEAFGALERATRDAAQSVGRRVSFTADGWDVRLDAHVLSTLGEALHHLVRNAVAHGIEPEGERLAAGKPATGQVTLSVERRAGRVTFTCRDDGRGIDVAAVRRVAVARGLISRAQADGLRLEQAVSLLLRGGVSTAGTLSQVAGRGVGLDAVRDVVSRLRGEVEVQSDRSGTAVALRVAVSLWSTPALIVDVNGSTSTLPLDAVTQVLRLSDGDVVRSGGSASILFDGALIPFLPLAAVLGEKGRPAMRARSWSVVVLRSDGARAAIGVDRVRGIADEVVRPLPAVVGSVPAVGGASFDREGCPRLMLEPSYLVGRARAGVAVDLDATAERAPILVIDDSLTTRMLEQSILETAGYEVELATSAEEGLEKARSRRFAVFVVDVEMPGMDGYEFVALTRKDPALGQTPAILVTSRGSSEDRRRGELAGASAYIVKGEFDQGRLLSAIAELTGGR